MLTTYGENPFVEFHGFASASMSALAIFIEKLKGSSLVRHDKPIRNPMDLNRSKTLQKHNFDAQIGTKKGI